MYTRYTGSTAESILKAGYSVQSSRRVLRAYLDDSTIGIFAVPISRRPRVDDQSRPDRKQRNRARSRKFDSSCPRIDDRISLHIGSLSLRPEEVRARSRKRADVVRRPRESGSTAPVFHVYFRLLSSPLRSPPGVYRSIYPPWNICT